MKHGEDNLTSMVAAAATDHPGAARAIDRLITIAPMFRSAARDMLRAYGTTFLRRADDRVAEIDFLCDGDAERFDEAVRAYVRFCMEFARKQAEFLRTGRYSFQDFDEMCAELYDDNDAVQNFYLFALLFSFIFSPNYYEFYDFFETEFLPHVHDTGCVCEIGCGHGVYLGKTLAAHHSTTGVAIDISPAALEVAQRMLGYYQIGSQRVEFAQDDLRHRLRRDDGCAQAVICCEVLEHLPDPQRALHELRRILGEGGTALLSAAIRMESVDHLYVFRTHDEVIEMIEKAGLRLEASRVIPLAKGNMQDEEERRRLAEDPRVPVGFICRASPK
ncbi:MAG: class I SAM-dependent methyltransferase [Planctomycetes bacterium]|nr:class I SAM-dependent methyltransferase [Planctomycetota bacterium]